MKKQLSPLKRRAEENTSVTHKIGRDEEQVKSGTPLDHVVKHDVSNDLTTFQVVGVNKGLTRNMGDFQSLRIDCWLTDHVRIYETVDQAFQRVGAIIDEQLELQMQEYI